MCLGLTAPATVGVTLRPWSDRLVVVLAAAIGQQREYGAFGGRRSAATLRITVVAVHDHLCGVCEGQVPRYTGRSLRTSSPAAVGRFVEFAETEAAIAGALVALPLPTVRFGSAAVTGDERRPMTGPRCRRRSARERVCLSPVSSRYRLDAASATLCCSASMRANPKREELRVKNCAGGHGQDFRAFAPPRHLFRRSTRSAGPVISRKRSVRIKDSPTPPSNTSAARIAAVNFRSASFSTLVSGTW